MKTINLTNKEIKKLQLYDLDTEIVSNECKMYRLDENYLLKRLNRTTGSSFANKLFNVSLLNDVKKDLNIPEFVIPKYLVSKDYKIIGLALREVKNADNLGVLLNNPSVSYKEKLKNLRRLGKLIEKVYKQDVLNFRFGDLHPYNFLAGKDRLYAVDLDGAYLDINHPIFTYYFGSYTTAQNASLFPNKYELGRDDTLYANIESDLLFYNYMILDALGGTSTHVFDINSFYNYINYLEDLGYPQELLDSFRALYSNRDNMNPYEYLSDISEEMFNKASYEEYKKIKFTNK